MDAGEKIVYMCAKNSDLCPLQVKKNRFFGATVNSLSLLRKNTKNIADSSRAVMIP